MKHAVHNVREFNLEGNRD